MMSIIRSVADIKKKLVEDVSRSNMRSFIQAAKSKKYGPLSHYVPITTKLTNSRTEETCKKTSTDITD